MSERKLVYLSDFFYGETNGGAEQNDDVLLSLLEEDGWHIEKRRTEGLNRNEAKKFYERGYKFLVSNFVFLFNSVKDFLTNNADYILWEHDHKYLDTRNPADYDDFKAPPDQLVNVDFYHEASAVVCQSLFHERIMKKNLGNRNTVVFGASLWPETLLNKMKNLLNKEKEDRFAILDSSIRHKNTDGAIAICEAQDYDYDLLGGLTQEEFLEELARYQHFVFLPQTPETLSRVVLEARMLGCHVYINQNIGAASMPWFGLKEEMLIEFMKDKHDEAVSIVNKVFGYEKEDSVDMPEDDSGQI